MKIKKIAGVCKAQGQAVLLDYTDGDGVMRQWIYTGTSIYPVENLPYLTEGHLATILDLSEKQRESMHIDHATAPDTISFEDVADGEVLAEPLKLSVAFEDRLLQPYLAGGACRFVDWALLEPIAAEHRDTELWLRRQPNGRPYFAVKEGMLVVGYVWPMAGLDSLAALLRTAGERYRDVGEETDG